MNRNYELRLCIFKRYQECFIDPFYMWKIFRNDKKFKKINKDSMKKNLMAQL